MPSLRLRLAAVYRVKGANCGRHLRALKEEDLSETYRSVRVLEVHSFTDLHIFLSSNPHYAAKLAELDASCPKRMGCLYHFLFAPQPLLQRELDAAVGVEPVVAVQVLGMVVVVAIEW